VKFWILIFSAALFAGGTCLGIALRPTLAEPEAPAPKPASEAGRSWYGRDEFSVTRFAYQLDLSEEQDAELDRILEDTHRDADAYGRALRAAHERARERVTALLTPEQRTKLDELLAEERKRRSEGELRKSVDAYTRLLKLTPEQSEAFAAILARGKARKHAYFAEGGPKRDRDGIRGFFRQLKEEQGAELQAALSPEQFAAYREIQDLFDR
jgi:Spy/CpxP family protein refolding chaperone